MTETAGQGAQVETARRSTLRDAQKQQTRAQLLEAARAVFEEHGYVNATVDDIVARTGASRGTFYFHFGSKAAIMAELITTVRDQTTAALRQAVPQHWDSIEGLERWLELYADHFVQRRDFMSAWVQAEAVEPELNRLQFTNMRERVGHYHEAASRRGVADDGGRSASEVEMDVALFTAMAERFFQIWLVDGVPFDRSTAIRRLARLWYLTIFGSFEGLEYPG